MVVHFGHPAIVNLRLKINVISQLDFGYWRVNKGSEVFMLRQSLALLVAYAVLLLGVCPELSAQEQYPPQPQYPQQQDPQLQQPPPVNQSQSGVWNEQPPMPQQPYPGPGQAPQGPYAQQAPQGEEAGGIDIAGSETAHLAGESVPVEDFCTKFCRYGT